MQEYERGSKYARNQNDHWVCASDAVHDSETYFFCDCPDRHKMKLVKPSGNPDKRRFMDYFAHISCGHKRANGETVITCRSGGESEEHKNAKHKLREMVGQFSFVVAKCRNCRLELVEDGLNASILVEIQSDDRKWRYDCVLIRNDVKVIALEIYHKHATTQSKVFATRQDGLQIAEFRAEDVNALVPGTKINNLQVRAFLCLKCQIDQADTKKREHIKKLDAAVLDFYQDERKQLAWLEGKKDEAFWKLYPDRIYFYSSFVNGRYHGHLSTKRPNEPTYGLLYLREKNE
jgi:hypothetical protein